MPGVRRRVVVAVIVCVAAAHLAASHGPHAPVSCFVTTASGDVEGQDAGASCAFLGIPYAAAPVESFRWKPPQPVSPWASPLMVKTPPPSCPNMGANNTTPGGNEDCLKLNLWVRNPLPATPAPVIVWIHTGSFTSASANFPSHKGQRLAEETGVIVVAPNYRLGPFGFLAHGALAAEDPSHPGAGNYGLLDQRAALEWVRDNIARFGGDPNNVTLAGTSAGGDSVGLHLGSPGSRGLFHRAVIESGSPVLRWPTAADGESQGEAFANALGCTDVQTVLACLRSKTRDQILQALPLGTPQVIEPAGRTFWGPVVDGQEIPDQPRVLFETGQFSPMPVLLGVTGDEAAGSFITRSFPAGVTLAQYETWVGNEFGADANAVLGTYPAASFASPRDAMARLVTDVQFTCEARRISRILTDAHQPVFLYSYEYNLPDVSADGVVHGLESNLLFGNNYVPPQYPNHVLTAADLQLHAAMAGYWTRFAATGSPNVDDDAVVHWPSFTDSMGLGRSSNKFLVLDAVIHADKRIREAPCNFWAPYFLRSALGPVPALN